MNERTSDAPTTDDVVVLPWWRNPWNMVVLAVGLLALAFGGGFVVGERNATPDPTSTDIGFLQDMRTHHEQAVEMSLLFLEKPDTDPVMHLIAKEIAFDQAVESGRMIQLLRQYGEAEANQSGTAMGWMNQPVPEDRMPGLASDADLERLVRASGADADALFAQLMIAHHEGGIAMATYAADHSGTSEVEAFAKSMISGQQGEVNELRGLISPD